GSATKLMLPRKPPTNGELNRSILTPCARGGVPPSRITNRPLSVAPGLTTKSMWTGAPPSSTSTDWVNESNDPASAGAGRQGESGGGTLETNAQYRPVFSPATVAAPLASVLSDWMCSHVELFDGSPVSAAPRSRSRVTSARASGRPRSDRTLTVIHGRSGGPK